MNNRLICINSRFPLKKSELFVKIATGVNHACGLTTDGRVFTWGSGEEQQLGRKLFKRRLSNGLVPEALTNRAKDIFCGYYNTFVITDTDKVLACGLNSHSQTGIIQKPSKTVPSLVQTLTEVKGLPEGKVKQIAAHYIHTLLLFENGTVCILGGIDDGKSEQWNEDDYKPLLLDLKDIIKINASNHYNLALNSTGDVFYWYGRKGQIQKLKVTIPKNTMIHDIEQNDNHVLFLIR